MRKFFFPIFLTLFSLTSVWADLRDQITKGVEDVIPNVQTQTSNFNYVAIAKEAQFWIFAFIGLIAVAYLLWTGAKLLWAPGNTEEVTTSLKSIVFVGLGLALIPFAYFIVQFIINLRIN